MKKKILFMLGLVIALHIYPQSKSVKATNSDNVSGLKALLNDLYVKSDNKYFKIHCNSILEVINSKATLTKYDSTLLSNLYQIFSDESVSWNASLMSSYTERKRPFIISWKSPTDNVVSLAWLILPENWDPEKSYPLYVRLHGLAGIYSDPIEYMIYYFKPGTEVSATFNDGYTLLPWARGNQWYENISEKDVWESINVLETIVNIDPSRKYLVGFSMGGFGTWHLGQKSPSTWAALGIFAGALEYDQNSFNANAARNLSNVPVYIVCGTNDNLLTANEKAYEYLQNVQNPDISFNTFTGGHEALLPEWQLMYDWIKNFSSDNTEIDYSKKNENNKMYAQPNPFQLKTSINYSVSGHEKTKLIIYNISGKKVRTLVNSCEFPGEKNVTWNGADDSGNILPEGIYICNLNTSVFQVSIKIVLLKR